jgi:hypothetical protein
VEQQKSQEVWSLEVGGMFPSFILAHTTSLWFFLQQQLECGFAFFFFVLPASGSDPDLYKIQNITTICIVNPKWNPDALQSIGEHHMRISNSLTNK